MGTPGVNEGREVTPRTVETQASKDRVVTTGVNIDSAVATDGKNTNEESFIRGGWIGARSSNGKYVPLKRSKLTNPVTASATLVVDDSSAFKVADNLFVGGSLVANAIVNIDYGTDTITATNVVTAPKGTLVVGPNTTGTPCGIFLRDEVDLRNRDRTIPQDKENNLAVAGGPLDFNLILGDLDAALEATQCDFRRTFFDQIIDGRTIKVDPSHVRQARFSKADLAAGDDTQDDLIFVAGTPVAILSIGILSLDSPAGIDGSNTSAWAFRRLNSTDDLAIKTETYDDVNIFPEDGEFRFVADSLLNSVLQVGDRLVMDVTNGATADPPAVEIVITYLVLGLAK